MKKIILILVLISASARAQWVQVGIVSTTRLNTVKFFDENTGLVGGSAGIWRTTNGGVNWTQRTGTLTIYSMNFLDNLNGYATGNAKIIKTTDGGVSWVDYNLTNGLTGTQSISFFNINTGVSVGYDGIINRTTNAGANWYRQDSNYFQIQNGVSVLSSGVGWIAGGSPYEFVKKTVNYGATWQYQGLGTIGGLNAVAAINDNTAFICGGTGTIRRTTNGGANWFLQDSIGRYLNAVSFLDANTGTCVGRSGTIVRTTNSGNNWVIQPSGTNQILYGVSFINSNTGWAVGFNGIVLRTTNGGITFIKPLSNQIPEGFRLEQNYPNPFNGSTKLKIQISKLSDVKIIIYDVLGTELSILVHEEFKPGTYELEWNGTKYPSGIYCCRLETSDFSETRKLILLK